MRQIPDVDLLRLAVDNRRRSEGLSWRELARQLGVRWVTISKLTQGFWPDEASLASLVGWLGVPVEEYCIWPPVKRPPPPAPVHLATLLAPDHPTLPQLIVRAAFDSILFPRGFKELSAEIVAEVRAELDVDPTMPLDPRRVAKAYGVEFVDMNYWFGTNVTLPGRFGAMTHVTGLKRRVWVNPHHEPQAQRHSLARALAHHLLEHEPVSASEGPNPAWDPVPDREARWTGAELLVPTPAAVAICAGGESVRDAAARFGVTVELMEWRIRASGARREARRR